MLESTSSDEVRVALLDVVCDPLDELLDVVLIFADSALLRLAYGFRQMIFDSGIHLPLDPSRIALGSTDLSESNGGFSLGGFSSLCCFAALGRAHHLALPAGANAFAVTHLESPVDSVGKL